MFHGKPACVIRNRRPELWQGKDKLLKGVLRAHQVRYDDKKHTKRATCREQKGDGSGSVIAQTWQWLICGEMNGLLPSQSILQGLQPMHGEAPQRTKLAPGILVDDVEDHHQRFQTPAQDRLPVDVLLFHEETTAPQFLFCPYVRMFSTMLSRKDPTEMARQFPDDRHDLVPWDRLRTEDNIERQSAITFSVPPA